MVIQNLAMLRYDVPRVITNLVGSHISDESKDYSLEVREVYSLVVHVSLISGVSLAALLLRLHTSALYGKERRNEWTNRLSARGVLQKLEWHIINSGKRVMSLAWILDRM